MNTSCTEKHGKPQTMRFAVTISEDAKPMAPIRLRGAAKKSTADAAALANHAVENHVPDIMCPSDTMGIIPAMEKLEEVGIPVINLNTRIGGDKKLAETFVAIENYDAGYQTVVRLAELMGGKGDFILLEGVSGAQTSIDRTKGAIDALKNFPDITLVA